VRLCQIGSFCLVYTLLPGPSILHGLENLKIRDNSEDLGAGGKIILDSVFGI
jgi:hypothetical protein